MNEYILAATYYFGKLGIDYTVGGFSGADVIVLTGENGKIVSASQQYDAIEIDNDRAIKCYGEIAAAPAE